MPDKLRRLSGDEVIGILGRFGFEPISQRGSHIKLRRLGPDGTKQTLHVPRHREVRSGTLLAIYRQACRFIPADELRPHFFTS